MGTRSVLSAYAPGEQGCGLRLQIAVMLQLQNLHIHVSQDFRVREQLE